MSALVEHASLSQASEGSVSSSGGSAPSSHPLFPGRQGAPQSEAAENQGEGWAEEGPVSSLAAVSLITASQSSWGSLVPRTTRSLQDNGLFLGGEAAQGRDSGGGASFLQSVPQHPASACGTLGGWRSGARVPGGWQGLAGLIQLAGPPPSRHNSGPAGAELGQLLFVLPAHAYGYSPSPFRHHSHFWHLRLHPSALPTSHPTPTLSPEQATLAAPEKLGNCVAAWEPRV